MDTSCVQTLEDQCTGQAYILSNKNDGENSIIIVGGANQAYQVDPGTQSGLKLEWEQAIQNSDVLLLQLEIP